MSARLGCLVIALAAGCSSSGRTGTADLAGSGTHVGSGAVTLSQQPAMPSGFKATASASFRRDTQPAIPCTTQMVAGCAARSCTFIMDLGTPPAADPVSAGTLTISGGSAPLTLTPGSDHTYAPALLASGLWLGGEMLTATAPGEVAPGFTETLVAPAAVAFTAPAGPVMVTSGQDLTLSTTSTDTINVAFTIVNQSMPITTLDVSCPIKAAGGSVVVPGAALALAPKGKTFSRRVDHHDQHDRSGGLDHRAVGVGDGELPGQLPTLAVQLQ